MKTFSEARSWRIYRHDDGEHFMFFDARYESPGVRSLTEVERSGYLDSVGSVSAVDLDLDQPMLFDGCNSSAEHLSAEPPSGFVESLWEGFDG